MILWKASARRGRRVLQERYGRGPRKKPPDPPDPAKKCTITVPIMANLCVVSS